MLADRVRGPEHMPGLKNCFRVVLQNVDDQCADGIRQFFLFTLPSD
jgi:hypothetical protein